MDDQLTKSTTNDTGSLSDSDQMLPAVNGEENFSGSPAAQTIPTDRSLVPAPEEAADSDLIEKEWVIKAKQIVEHTAEDPFQQQEELSKMKAAYMKKRYNKDIGSS
jgi:hypothetical protein